MKSSWGDKLILTLIGTVISLLVLIGTTFAAFPTRGEVSEMIQQEAPYAQDRSLILYRLEQIEKKLDQLLAK